MEQMKDIPNSCPLSAGPPPPRARQSPGLLTQLRARPGLPAQSLRALLGLGMCVSAELPGPHAAGPHWPSLLFPSSSPSPSGSRPWGVGVSGHTPGGTAHSLGHLRRRRLWHRSLQRRWPAAGPARRPWRRRSPRELTRSGDEPSRRGWNLFTATFRPQVGQTCQARAGASLRLGCVLLV